MTDAAASLTRLRDELVAATLPHVPFDGWSERALARGAADAGHDVTAARRAFPRGAAQLVEHHGSWADRRMLGRLEAMDLGAMRTPERVAAAVRLWLEQSAADREAIRRALTFLAQPQHAALGLACLYRTVDAIWYATGDTATDFNFYTKRALLAGVFAATLLYWLDDDSDGSAASWAFLDRRLADATRAPQWIGRLRASAARLPNPLRLMRVGRRFE